MIRRTGKEENYDLKRMGIGDDYASALSESLRKVPSVEKLNLLANRLTEVGSVSILNSVRPEVLKELNLGYNRIGQASVDKLVELLGSPLVNIKHLNLEKCRMGT